MRAKPAHVPLQIAAILFLILMMVFPPTIGRCGDEEEVWYVHDVIDPSLEKVKWFEEGARAAPPGWIADGRWYQASMSQSLVGENNLFVLTYEQFNWLYVRQTAEDFYNTTFNSFQEFENAVEDNPGPWLDLSWGIDTFWYGVSLDATKVKASFNETSATADLWAWFHITRIPEYIVAEGNLENWLTGFDLTPLSIGSLSLWEFHKNWGPSGITYSLRFEAPASILSQHGDNFTCTIPVSTYYQSYTFKIQQVVEINMPANTEIKQTQPSDMCLTKGNTASFIIHRGDWYPASYTVLSGPPVKSLGESIQESVSDWLFTPGGWAAIGSLLVLGYTGVRGRRIVRRNSMYRRLYKGMVSLYDLYSKDLSKFHQEMENISNSIFKMLVEDRITDEQFEKLLKRRDDLLERSEKQQPPPPQNL